MINIVFFCFIIIMVLHEITFNSSVVLSSTTSARSSSLYSYIYMLM